MVTPISLWEAAMLVSDLTDGCYLCDGPPVTSNILRLSFGPLPTLAPKAKQAQARRTKAKHADADELFPV